MPDVRTVLTDALGYTPDQAAPLSGLELAARLAAAHRDALTRLGSAARRLQRLAIEKQELLAGEGADRLRGESELVRLRAALARVLAGDRLPADTLRRIAADALRGDAGRAGDGPSPMTLDGED